MSVVNEVAKEIILNDIKDLPLRLTAQDIYDFLNKDNRGYATVGKNTAYDIAKNLGYRFKEGGRIYVNKTDFIKFIYEGEEIE